MIKNKSQIKNIVTVLAFGAFVVSIVLTSSSVSAQLGPPGGGEPPNFPGILQENIIEDGDIIGYAWGASDEFQPLASQGGGMGWLNFNCKTEENCVTVAGEWGTKIELDENSANYGQLSGHAYSSNYGYLNFEDPNISMCYGSGNSFDHPVKVLDMNSPSGLKLAGWARFQISDTTYWDGCVSFKGDGEIGSVSYGVGASTVSGGMFGWAWGGESQGYQGPGWISFDCDTCNAQVILPDAVLIDFRADRTSLGVGGGPVTLSWQATDNEPTNRVETCSVYDAIPSTSDWSSTSVPPSPWGINRMLINGLPTGQHPLNVTETTRFRLGCQDANGFNLPTQYVTVVVTTDPGGGGITVDANPNDITYANFSGGNADTTITWSGVENYTSCVASPGDFADWLGTSVDISGSQFVSMNGSDGGVAGQTYTFTVTCDDNGTPVSGSDTVEIQENPGGDPGLILDVPSTMNMSAVDPILIDWYMQNDTNPGYFSAGDSCDGDAFYRPGGDANAEVSIEIPGWWGSLDVPNPAVTSFELDLISFAQGIGVTIGDQFRFYITCTNPLDESLAAQDFLTISSSPISIPKVNLHITDPNSNPTGGSTLIEDISIDPTPITLEWDTENLASGSCIATSTMYLDGINPNVPNNNWNNDSKNPTGGTDSFLITDPTFERTIFTITCEDENAVIVQSSVCLGIVGSDFEACNINLDGVVPIYIEN